MTATTTVGEQRGQLLMLAFDHRDHLVAMADRCGTRGLSAHAAVTVAKELALDAALAVRSTVEAGAARGLGIFVDEQFGAVVALRARDEGLVLAMPAERSGSSEFITELGHRQADHLARLRPDLVKVLVRWNPDGDKELNHRQGGRLAELSEWCRSTGPGLLFELLVPPTAEQDGPRFVEEQRVDLTIRAVEEVVAAGIRPGVWKLEAPAAAPDFQALRSACLGYDPAALVVVLGGGADLERTTRSVAEAAEAGLDGFAVGRSIWDAPLSSWLAGEIEDDVAVEQIATGYRRCVDAFLSGAERWVSHP